MRRKKMNCNFHKDREAVAKCKVCGKDLCKECDEVNQKYSACPGCAKNTLQTYQQNIKRGLLFNILSIVCAFAFVAMYIVALALGKLSVAYIVVGAVLIAILVPVSVFMLCYSLKNLKAYKSIIALAEEEPKAEEQKEPEAEEPKKD